MRTHVKSHLLPGPRDEILDAFGRIDASIFNQTLSTPWLAISREHPDKGEIKPYWAIRRSAAVVAVAVRKGF